MLGEIPFFLEANKQVAILNGAIANLEMPRPQSKRKPTNGTARHEAKHVVAAIENNTSVVSATIISGEGYLGLTVLSKPDVLAALAPHATGESGTGHDVRIAEMIGGGSQSAARAVIENNMDKVDAVACALEDHGTLDWFGIKRAIADSDKPKVEFGILHIELPTGEKLKENVEIRDNVIMESGIWYQVAVKTNSQINQRAK